MLSLSQKSLLSHFIIISFLATGCRHKVELTSLPSGAAIYHGKKELGFTPMVETFWWWPGRRIELTAKLPRYRNLTINASNSISSWKVTKDFIGVNYFNLVGYNIRGHHQYVLIRNHSPAGSWTAEDAQKLR